MSKRKKRPKLRNCYEPRVAAQLRRHLIRDGSLHDPAGHNPLMTLAADLLEDMYDDCVRLAADVERRKNADALMLGTVNASLLDALKAVDRQLPDADMCFDADNSLRDIVRKAIATAEGG